MAIEKLSIDQFLLLARHQPVFDVRSPAEYLHAHIPRAFSLPLFTDEERKIVGTIYKQQNRQLAIKAGMDMFGVKMRSMVEKAEEIVATYNTDVKSEPLKTARATVLVHCWRGGMRSAAVAWLLDLYGFKVYTLAGGYKAFRNRVLQSFKEPWQFKILGGYTGSGKTLLLEEMERLSQPVVNLEAIANHKGSAFGDLGQPAQPSQEMFENMLSVQLSGAQLPGKERLPIWLEDESRRIGILNIPVEVWNNMRSSPVYFVDIPFEERLTYIVDNYGAHAKDKLAAAILRIQKRLGGLDTKNALAFLEEGNTLESFSILLRYYDKCYAKGLQNRDNAEELINPLICDRVSTTNVAYLPQALHANGPT